MRRVLVTGVSGVGKTVVISELAVRGYRAVDLDCDEYSEWVDASDFADAAGEPVQPDRDWVWRLDRVQALLEHDEGDVLFVAGCAANMGALLPRFDDVVLLSAPEEIVVARLAQRAEFEYGAHPDDVDRVRGLIETVEPLLRRVAGLEVDTSAPFEDVIEALLRVAQEGPPVAPTPVGDPPNALG
jgi:gluconate kinase